MFANVAAIRIAGRVSHRLALMSRRPRNMTNPDKSLADIQQMATRGDKVAELFLRRLEEYRQQWEKITAAELFGDSAPNVGLSKLVKPD